MNRFKTYNATGVAPDGRLYAGDMNLFQDLVAALSDFTQTVDVGTLRIGSSDIQLLKYGAAEARLSSALRIDKIFRPLGGMVAGTFTTAQRDAIAAGQRPYGLIILNSTTNQYEWNTGTDAAPVWTPFGVSTGEIKFWPSTTLPNGFLLCDGASYVRTTYATLFAVIGTAFGAVDGTHFNVPDLRGRVPVGYASGGKSEINAIGKSDGLAVTQRNISHIHTFPEAAPGTVVSGSPSTNLGPAPGVGVVSQTLGDGDNVNRPAFLAANFIIKT